MPCSKSLRAIGQSLESLHIDTFVIEKRGLDFVVRSEWLPPRAEMMLRNLPEKVWEFSDRERLPRLAAGGAGSLLYSPSYLSWLDARGRRKRRRRFSAQTRGSKSISQLLRTLGRYLDRVDTHTFQIRWSPGAVVVDYELSGGSHIRESLSFAKLQELQMRMRFRRAPHR
ncbi:MAG TPA: hypothetical protein VE131_03895 [Terriglobales bacterium]|nr:hypothetical protein [Terriglobales bacterium]